MKKIKLAFLGIASLVATGVAQATVINFDALAANTIVDNLFPEVTFSSTAGNVAVFPYPCCTDTLPNTAAPWTGNGFNFSANMRLDFTTSVNNLSFTSSGDDFNGQQATIDIFDMSGLLATVGLLGDGTFNTHDFHDLSAYANITAIEIRNVTDPGGLTYDTFTFDAATVPEPATVALLGLGLAGLGFRRRKQS